jgi:hypothetical protein
MALNPEGFFMRPDDNRYIAELPTGIIKKPKLRTAGVDLYTNDAVYISGGKVYPPYCAKDVVHILYGVIATDSLKGKPVLVAVAE